jgi:hypothetical protein
LYLIAANWEIPELQQIAVLAQAADGETRRQLAARFLTRADNEKKFAAPLPGLAFGQWDIESLGSPGAEGAPMQSARKEE